ncbi:uncharacterized protein LOC135196082 [Macrobrachium nipponense]|uniref:uncharacterized protein LOC135196082 n=1 Tax=Macrobrachium nipponense TaxID=159736 RepID=UPI0030C804CC
MGPKLLLVAIAVGFSGAYNVLPDVVFSSLPSETRGNSTTVNRNDSSSSSSGDPREFHTDRGDDRHDLDSPYDQNHHRLDEEPLQGGRSLMASREWKQKHSICSKFLPLSIFGLLLIALGVFNSFVNGAILWDAINSSSVTSLTNSVTNANNNNNMDTNNDNNINANFDYNFNQIGRRYARQNGDGDGEFEPDRLDLEGSNATRNDDGLGRKASCACSQSRGGGVSWPSAAKTSFQRVWTVGQDFLSENPQCVSRMACDVASSFVPSSISPFLVVLPSGMEGARSLLLSAAGGHCAVTYDRCPVSLGPIVTSAMQWLEDSS